MNLSKKYYQLSKETEGVNKMAEINYKPDHMALSVSDLDRSMTWYENMFGFQTEVKFDRPDLRLKGAIMMLQGYGLELFQHYEPQALPEHSRTLASDLQVVGTKHLALLVDNVETAYRSLEDKGAEFDGGIVEGKTAKYFFAKDPDGILVEVKQALGGK